MFYPPLNKIRHRLRKKIVTMNVKMTYKCIKKFIRAEKLAILEEGKRNGIKVNLAKCFLETWYY